MSDLAWIAQYLNSLCNNDDLGPYERSSLMKELYCPLVCMWMTAHGACDVFRPTKSAMGPQTLVSWHQVLISWHDQQFHNLHGIVH